MSDIIKQINLILVRFGLQTSGRSIMDLYLIFTFSVPVSILIYLIFDKYRHKILVELGQHKWIVRLK